MILTIDASVECLGIVGKEGQLTFHVSICAIQFLYLNHVGLLFFNVKKPSKCLKHEGNILFIVASPI